MENWLKWEVIFLIGLFLFPWIKSYYDFAKLSTYGMYVHQYIFFSYSLYFVGSLFMFDLIYHLFEIIKDDYTEFCFNNFREFSIQEITNYLIYYQKFKDCTDIFHSYYFTSEVNGTLADVSDFLAKESFFLDKLENSQNLEFLYAIPFDCPNLNNDDLKFLELEHYTKNSQDELLKYKYKHHNQQIMLSFISCFLLTGLVVVAFCGFKPN